MDEVLNLLQTSFPYGFISSSSEVILEKTGNVYFSVHSGMTREEIIFKILEWCSRHCAKGEPYKNSKRNSEWRDSLCLRFNRYLGTNFNQNDFYWIYDRLGNAVNHDLTIKFVESGFNMDVLMKEEST